ncbi:MAG: hypothetical protein IT207_02625 [Fimbriimonadaceae bacterium]|nr:hypothetical protein [Fimbriimonadaceae bacterium]
MLLLLAATFVFEGGRTGTLACQLAEATMHPWIAGIGTEPSVEKFEVRDVEPVLKIGAFQVELAKALAGPLSPTTGALPPRRLNSLGAGGPKKLDDYVLGNTQDPNAIAVTDEGKVVFGPTGAKSVSWQILERNLKVKLDVHFLYRQTLFAGSAQHLGTKEFLDLAAAAVGARVREDDGTYHVEPDYGVLRRQLVALHEDRSLSSPHAGIRKSGKFAASVIGEIPEQAMKAAFAKEGARIIFEANLVQSEQAVSYLLSCREELPGLVRTIVDNGCLTRPIGIELNSDGSVQAAFRGPPGTQQVTYFL